MMKARILFDTSKIKPYIPPKSSSSNNQNENSRAALTAQKTGSTSSTTTSSTSSSSQNSSSTNSSSSQTTKPPAALILYTSIPDGMYMAPGGGRPVTAPTVTAAIGMLGEPGPKRVPPSIVLAPFCVGSISETGLLTTTTITVQDFAQVLAASFLGDYLDSDILALADGNMPQDYYMPPDTKNYYPVGAALVGESDAVGDLTVVEPGKYEIPMSYAYTIFSIQYLLPEQNRSKSSGGTMVIKDASELNRALSK